MYSRALVGDDTGHTKGEGNETFVDMSLKRSNWVLNRGMFLAGAVQDALPGRAW